MTVTQYKVLSDDGTRLTVEDAGVSTPFPIEDPYLNHAINIIKGTYGVDVSIHTKNKDILKFGRSDQVQAATETTLMTLPSGTYNETYISDNLITHISSSSGGDTEDVSIEGHTIDGSGNFTFVTQIITLVGQTKTALTTPIARCSRIRNEGSNNLVGSIYVYEDDTVVAGVPQTATKVHCMIEAGKNNSEKSATTVSHLDYWIITQVYADVLEKTSATADVALEVRLKGKTFIRRLHLGCSTTSGSIRDITPYIIIPANSDIRLTATASANGTTVSGGIHGVLAIEV